MGNKKYQNGGSIRVPGYRRTIPLSNVGSVLNSYEDNPLIYNLGIPLQRGSDRYSRRPRYTQTDVENIFNNGMKKDNGIHVTPTPYYQKNFYEDVVPNLKNEGKPKVNKNSTPQKVGKTISQLWVEETGTPWSEAKKLGLTDGTKKANLALMKRLQSGEVLKRKPVEAISGSAQGLQEWAGPNEDPGYFGKTKLNPSLQQLLSGNVEEVYQSGGEVEQQKIQQEVLQALQNGADPQDIMERLIQFGLDPDEAQVFVQEMLQIVQQQQASGQQVDPQAFQEGGEMEDQIMQAVVEALQSGAEPEEVVEFLVQQGIPQEQAMQIVQQVSQNQFQEGGQMINDLVQGVTEALDKGENPEELIEYLISEKGIPQEQATSLVQQVMQMKQQ